MLGAAPKNRPRSCQAEWERFTECLRALVAVNPTKRLRASALPAAIVWKFRRPIPSHQRLCPLPWLPLRPPVHRDTVVPAVVPAVARTERRRVFTLERSARRVRDWHTGHPRRLRTPATPTQPSPTVRHLGERMERRRALTEHRLERTEHRPQRTEHRLQRTEHRLERTERVPRPIPRITAASEKWSLQSRRWLALRTA